MEKEANILIVDDEFGPRESLRMILKPLYNVLAVENGETAIETIKSSPIDLVTLDLRMQGLQGADVLREIKKINSDVEVIIVTGYASVKSAIEAVRYGAFDYIQKPFNVAEILSTINKSLERKKLYEQLKDFLKEIGKIVGTDTELMEAKDRIASNTGLMDSIKTVFNKIAEKNNDKDLINYLEFARVIANTLESKDPYSYDHSGRVNYYVNLLAQKLSLSQKEMEDLQIATFLHDIGKIGIANTFIFKEGNLTEIELSIIRKHPEVGASLVEPLQLSPLIMSAIRHHHEWYDGSGYPDGLVGDEIPYCARIVAIADAYDAMSSDRPYRKALSLKNIKKEYIKNAGIQFDPEMVKVFLEILDSSSNIIPNKSVING
ncbi:MAG: response regulator [Nitrospirae bacterium]|nr:response regulator [Nitrospirota bacterium]